MTVVFPTLPPGGVVAGVVPLPQASMTIAAASVNVVGKRINNPVDN
jgi:hypothetical protein